MAVVVPPVPNTLTAATPIVYTDPATTLDIMCVVVENGISVLISGRVTLGYII